MTSRITSWHASLAVLLAGCWMGEYVALQVHGKYLAFALPAERSRAECEVMAAGRLAWKGARCAARSAQQEASNA